MFNRKEIEEIKRRLNALENRQYSFMKHASKVLRNLTEVSKKHVMYELREEDVELIKDGKKYRKIRKIIS